MVPSQRYVSEELTHFVGRGLDTRAQYDLLVRVLREGRLTPPPHEPDRPLDVRVDPDEPISGNRAYEPRVVCFADIPVGDLHLHIRKYSPFGIAFRKTVVAARGANPVFYVASASRSAVGEPRAETFDEMARRFHALRKEASARRAEDEFFAEFLELARFLDYEVWSFCKFFDDPLPDDDPQNFYMEREWRLHGAFEFALDDVRRVVLPEAYARAFRDEVPAYAGQVTFWPND